MSRSISRSLTIAAIAALGVTMLFPAAQARGHSIDPPFELRFPQETDKTDFNNDWRVHRAGGRRHRGTDLMAEKMTEVYAVADGVVVKVGSSRRPGRYLIIEHAGGWESYYIHLNNDNVGTDDGECDWSLTVASGITEGARVEAGQLIGWAGDSGNAEGSSPHTHFELHHNGRAVNPYRHLEEAFQRDHADYLRLQRLPHARVGGPVQID